MHSFAALTLFSGHLLVQSTVGSKIRPFENRIIRNRDILKVGCQMVHHLKTGILGAILNYIIELLDAIFILPLEIQT